MLAPHQGRLRATATAVLLAAPLFAGVSGVVPVSTLILQADLIVAGDIISGSDAGSQVIMDIAVVRTLKGTVEPGKIIIAQWQSPATPSFTSRPVAKHTGLFFLGVTGTAPTILPVVGGDVRSSDLYIPLPHGDLPVQKTYDAGTALPDRVAAELAAAAGAVSVDDFAAGLLYLEGLESIKAASTAIYESLAVSPSPHAAAIGIAGLVRSSNPTAPGRVKSEYRAISKSVHFSHVVNGICGYYHSTSPQALAALADLATDTNGEISLRRCSAHALRAVHTKDALSALRQLLDSADQTTRYEAVFGLAAFANNLPIQLPENTANMGFLKSAGDGPFTTTATRSNTPSLPEFRGNETKYLTFWKQWWAEVQAKL